MKRWIDVIGSPAIFRHVTDAGMRIVNGTHRASEAQLVVVAGHDDFHFAELRSATQAVLAGAEMIATSPRRLRCSRNLRKQPSRSVF